MRRGWKGLESIEPGDRIRYETPNGVKCDIIVARPLAIISTPSADRALRLFSERISIPNSSIDFASFERVVAEDWITHWRGRRVASSSSGQPTHAVESSTTKGMGTQSPFPLQEGARDGNQER